MKKFIITLTMLLFFPFNALAEKLVFATGVWPPYVIEENGKAAGIDVDIIREACKRNGIEADIKIFPWKRSLHMVKNGNADALFSPKYTEERAEFMYYPKENLNMEKTVIAAKAGSGIIAQKLDDLKDKLFGVVRGYTYAPEFDRKELKRNICDDDNQMIKILSKDRVELVAGEEGGLRFISKQLGVQLETIYVLEETPNFVTFSKTLGEKGKIWAEKFGKILSELKEDGTVEKIRNKYIY